MTIKNTRNSYGSVSKFLHWLLFIMVTVMLIVGFLLDGLPKSQKPLAFMLHKSTGLLILGLMVARLGWRWLNTTPQLSALIPAWQRAAAHAVHYLLYVALLAMPISGWIMSTAANKAPTFYGLGLLPFPGIPHSKAWGEFFFEMHQILAWVIIALIVMHILAALKHHYINKDDVLKRMLPGE